MLSLSVDRNDGTIGLPNGHSIAASLSQEIFRQTPLFREARAQDYGTLPWIHYHFSGGMIEGHELLVSLCFYDQLLVKVYLTVDIYTAGCRDWSHYSLAVEAATKEFHERILEQLLGQPTKETRLPIGAPSSNESVLAQPLVWRFPWGRVGSGHDVKGGSTQITVTYGNRQEEASRAYRVSDR